MDAIIGIVLLVGLILAWNYHYSSTNPFRWFFTLTIASLIFLVAGTTGYNLNRHNRFVDGTGWSDTVIWWQVGVGFALLPLAALFWHRARRLINARLART
jgi:hypothetical protein